MNAQKRNSREKNKISNFETWSDHCLVAVFFIFLVLLGFIS